MKPQPDSTNAVPAADNAPPPAAGSTEASTAPSTTPARPVAPAVWQSEELFHGQREIVIQHGDVLYRLRRTRQGKLILHK